MPRYLPVKAQGGVTAIAICDRCHRKMYYADLEPDGNSPGLRVCKKCRDVKDPYRYPARKTEVIALRYPRPEDMGPVDNSTSISTEQPIPIDFPPDLAP